MSYHTPDEVSSLTFAGKWPYCHIGGGQKGHLWGVAKSLNSISYALNWRLVSYILFPNVKIGWKAITYRRVLADEGGVARTKIDESFGWLI